MNAVASASPVGTWIQGARPQTLVLSLAPIVVGVAYAHAAFGRVEIAPVAAATLSALAIQVATNLANDSADGRRGADGPERLGPMRLVGAGLMSAARVRRGAMAATLVAALAGLIVVAYGGAPILAVGVASLLAAWAYSYGPAPISASPLGELFVVAFFGIAATAGVVWLAAGAIDATAWLLGVAVGLPAAAVLTVNNHRDRGQDKASGRRTLAILLGSQRTAFLYTAELAAAALLAGVALWPFSRLSAAIAIGGLVAALARGHRVAHTPISRAMNRQLVATVRFQISLALAIVCLLMIGPR